MPTGSGRFRLGPYTYRLSADGDVWLFIQERPDGKVQAPLEEDFWWSGLSLNLPVPFQPGDILFESERLSGRCTSSIPVADLLALVP